jgi:hypothetical protein
MAKAIETFTGYTMDFTSQIQYAKSESGQVFKRMQYRDPRYGYKWGKWNPTAACSIEGKHNQGARNWRLPA